MGTTPLGLNKNVESWEVTIRDYLPSRNVVGENDHENVWVTKVLV